MKRITIKDIAHDAGVSASAVSLVLNNKPCRISEAKKEKIRIVAKKHNYVVNQIARSMVTKKSNMLGVIIPDIENIFFSALMKSLETNCRHAGYTLLVANSNDSKENDLRLIQLFTTHGVDGLFIVPSNESIFSPESVNTLLKSLSIPYVLVDRAFEGCHCDTVVFNNQKGGYDAVKYIIENGHERIGCVSAPLHNHNGRARLEGYMQAMYDSNLPVLKDFLYEGDYRFNSGYEAAEKLVQNTTAAFICNDMMAIGFLKYLYEHNMKVPDDYSVVSYDDVATPYMVTIDLSAIRQNVSELGSTAFDILISKVRKSREVIVESILLPTLMKRNSVKRIEMHR